MSDTTIDRLLAERDWLARLARRLVSDDATAADLAQDTWVAALSRPPMHERGLRGWLATLLRHRAHDRHRREKSETRRVERLSPPEATADPADVVARAEIEHRVAELVLALPPLYRDVLLLRYHEGMSPTEIARSTGTPPGTVRSRLSRGRDMMRERLDERSGGDRRTWMVALLPLARRTVPEKAVMLTLPLKFALIVGSLLLVGTAALHAVPSAGEDAAPVAPVDPTPSTARAAAVADDAAPVAGGEDTPADEAPPDGKEMSKKDAAALDTKTSVDFNELPLRRVLDHFTDITGIRFEMTETVGERIITLRADEITVRNALELITLTSLLRWELRPDGSVLISKEPPKDTPAPEKSTRMWFGSPSGFFDPDPRGVVDTEIRLPDSDMAEPLPREVMVAGIRVRLGADGTCWTGKPATPGRFGLWLALQVRRAAPVLIFADAACSVAAVRSAWGLAHGHERWLVTGDDTGLHFPGRPPKGTAPVRLFAQALPAEAGATNRGPKDLYESLYRVRAANPGSRIDLHVRLAEEATARHLTVLLGEARRFGLVVRGLDVIRPHRPTGSASLNYTLRYPDDIAVSDEAVPPMREGVVVAPSPRIDTHSAKRLDPAIISGRARLRNLRANGGGAKTVATVDRALHWLASVQAENGSWADDRGDTVAAVLAFLADPSSREGQRHAGALRRGLAWLAKKKDDRGDVAVAFAEAWALTGDPGWREAAEDALARTRSATARRLARCCGVDSPRIEAASPGTTPLACFGRILDGEVPWRSESLATAMNAFLEPVRDDPEALRGADPRFLHDATLAVYQAGGEAWVKWLTTMKRELLPTQIIGGDDAGSWIPPDGMSRVRAAALNAATLSVFYRYPRLFRRTR